MPRRTIAEVLKRHTGELMAIPGVVAVGEGELESRPCIRVFVTLKRAGSSRSIPAALDGYPVLVEESGDFTARRQ